MLPRHTCSYRVSYADTDRMDRVYYANYFEICERARTEFLRSVGHPYSAIEEEEGCFFPVRNCQARYRGYAVYDDLLICKSHIARLRHATLTFATDIHRGDDPDPLVSATVELACVDRSGKPRVIPETLRAALEPYLRDGEGGGSKSGKIA